MAIDGVDIPGLIESSLDNGDFDRLANDPLAQFGPPEQRLIGAEILPEVNVDENEFDEENIKYRTPVANHGTRYSPVQIKGGLFIGGMHVTLGYSDIGAQMKGREYDTFLRLLRRVEGTYGRSVRGGGARQPSLQAIAALMRFFDLGVVRPLKMRNEIDRWDAIISAQVVMKGDNNFRETVTFPNPTGHRVNAGGTWSDDTYDPIAGDIVPMIQFLDGLGYTVIRMISGQDVINILAGNAKVAQRGGLLALAGGTIVGVPALLSSQDVNAIFSKNKIPGIESYNVKYNVDAGTNFVYPRGKLTFICATGRDQELAPRGDEEPAVVHDTLGYLGVGTPAMRTSPGMATEVEFEADGKNSHIKGMGWQASFPVIADPEAIGVIAGIA